MSRSINVSCENSPLISPEVCPQTQGIVSMYILLSCQELLPLPSSSDFKNIVLVSSLMILNITKTADSYVDVIKSLMIFNITKTELIVNITYLSKGIEEPNVIILLFKS